MPYDILDKTTRFALPYGVHNIHSGNGKLVRHRTDVVGSSLQVTAQLALALGVLHSVKKLLYDGAEIPSANYNFFKGMPGEIAADSFFPSDVNHWLNPADNTSPAASFINFKLPDGMNVDNQPDKAVVQVECRETFDYDSSGNEIDFDYFTNPANAIADGGKIITGSTDLIEWGAWDEYKSWCGELITIIKDGESIEVPRFRLDAFFQPPFTLKQFLDRIMQLTCSDYQARGGKIRLIPAVDREPDFDFDTAKLAINYSFQPITDNTNNFNGVRVSFRDLDDELLQEAEEPVVVDRRASEDEPENFYELNVGCAYHDQAERVANYWAKVYCDLKDFASIRGSFKSYPVLPCDIVTVTHTTPGWTNKRCKVIKKTENEDTGIGYKLYLKVEPENPYSDSDYTPIETRTPAASVNPYSAPPPVALTLQAQSYKAQDGTQRVSVIGNAVFGDFGYKQTGKVFWLAPDAEDWEEIDEITPNADNQAQFRKYNLPIGTNTFKVIVVSGLFVEQTDPSEEDEVVVSAATFTINDTVIENGVLRAYTGFDANGKYTGRDTAPVPTSVMNAEVALSTLKDNGANVDFELQGLITDKSLQTSQADSLEQSEVTVFNKFGTIAKKKNGNDAVFNADYKGAGTLASGDLVYKYTDPREEAYYRFRLLNSKGWSAYKYLYFNGATGSYVLSTAPPTPKLASDCPQNLSASTLSSGSIRFNANFDFTGGKTLSLQKREVGSGFADWANHATGIDALPYDASDLPSDKEYEYRFLSSSGTNNASNIIRAKTWQIGQTAPDRAAPSGLTVIPDPADPDNNLKANWVRNATDNDSVDFEVDGVVTSLSAEDVEEYINSLGPISSRIVRVRNVWTSGTLTSDWTAPATGTTEATPTLNAPQNFAAVFDNPNNEIDMSWTEGDGAGTYIIEISDTGANPQAASGANGWTNLQSAYDANALSYSHAFAQTASQQSRWVRIKRSDVDGWVVSGEIIIPAEDNQGAQPPQWVSAYYDRYRQRFNFNWSPRGGSGTYVIEGDLNLLGTYTALSTTALSSQTSKTVLHSPPSMSDEEWYFRIRRTDVAGPGGDPWEYSDQVFIPVSEV